MNIYGFRKIRQGVDANSYFHPFFQKDRRDLLDKIQRVPVKGNSNLFHSFPTPKINNSSSAGTSDQKVESEHRTVASVSPSPELSGKLTIDPAVESVNEKPPDPPPITLPMKAFPSNFTSLRPKPVAQASYNLIQKYAAMVKPPPPLYSSLAFFPPSMMAFPPAFLQAPQLPESWCSSSLSVRNEGFSFPSMAFPPPLPRPIPTPYLYTGTSTPQRQAQAQTMNQPTHHVTASSPPLCRSHTSSTRPQEETDTPRRDDETDEWSRLLSQLEED